MIKNICKKILIVALIMIAFSIIISISNRCLALSDVTNTPIWEYWNPTVENDSDVIDKTGIILGVVRAVGVIVSVATLCVIGIKIMLGSAEEKANYKQTLIPWIIGATMVFAITIIPTTIYEMTIGSLNGGNSGGLNINSEKEIYIRGYDDLMYEYKQLNYEMPHQRKIAEAKDLNKYYGEGYYDAYMSLMTLSEGEVWYQSPRREYAEGSIFVANNIKNGVYTKYNIAGQYIHALDRKFEYLSGEETDEMINNHNTAQLNRICLQLNFWGWDILEKYAEWENYEEGFKAALLDIKEGSVVDLNEHYRKGSAYYQGYSYAEGLFAPGGEFRRNSQKLNTLIKKYYEGYKYFDNMIDSGSSVEGVKLNPSTIDEIIQKREEYRKKHLNDDVDWIYYEGEIDRLKIQKHIWNNDSVPVNNKEVAI